jgi:hypothetical protein
MKILHQFLNGHSGSSVYLVEENEQLRVYKTNIKNVIGVINIHNILPFSKPKIYSYTDTEIFMEYIPGISIKTYLETATTADLDKLVDYISSYYDFCLTSSNTITDFSDIVKEKQASINNYCNGKLSFNFDTKLPYSLTHGDLTFDNLIYHNGEFYMIDISPTLWNSIHFDANKLRQDLTGLWFVRTEENKSVYQSSCKYVYDCLDKRYPNIFNDQIYKIMLGRVLMYSKKSSFEYDFLMTEINSIDQKNK